MRYWIIVRGMTDEGEPYTTIGPASDASDAINARAGKTISHVRQMTVAESDLYRHRCSLYNHPLPA